MGHFGKRLAFSLGMLGALFLLGRLVLSRLLPSLGPVFLLVSPVLFGQFAPLAFIHRSKDWRPLPIGSRQRLRWQDDHAAPRTFEGTALCLAAGMLLYVGLWFLIRMGIWQSHTLQWSSGVTLTGHPRFFALAVSVVVCAVGADIASHVVYFWVPPTMRRKSVTLIWNVDTMVGSIAGLYLGGLLVGIGIPRVSVFEWVVAIALYAVVHAQVNIWLNWNESYGLKAYAAGEEAE